MSGTTPPEDPRSSGDSGSSPIERSLDLAHAMLDGRLDEAGAARLGEAMSKDPAFAEEVARLAFLHDAILREHHEATVGRWNARRLGRLTTIRRALAAAAVLAVAAVMGWMVLSSTPSASAGAILERLVAAARTGDRTYVLRAVESGAGDRRGRRGGEEVESTRSVDRRRHGSAEVPIDGARLVVRDPNLYVLVRTDGEGREVVTGCDGLVAWMVPAEGPVRVSRDLDRFRGVLPGSRFELPFLHPHEGLADLMTAYDAVEMRPAPDLGRPWPRLVATRRSEARGGPKHVEIEFDPETAVIRSMRLDHLPQARGGPRAVEFTLEDESPREASFFTHPAHHGSERQVIVE